MTVVPRHLRHFGLIVAAIVGLLSTVNDGLAGTTSGGRHDVRCGCCVGGSGTACCCNPAAASPSSRLTSALSSSAFTFKDAALTAPAFPCECRSTMPSTPAPKPDSRPSESRADRGGSESVDVVIDPPPPVATLARLNFPTSSPTESPLYLRTARLLI